MSEYCIRWIEDGDRFSGAITRGGEVSYFIWEFSGADPMTGDYWEMYEAGWFIVNNCPMKHDKITWDHIEIAFYAGETE